MEHFNFNQLGACMWDSYKAKDYIFCPTTTPVGKIVTIGRNASLKAIYIPCDTPNEDLALHYVDLMPNAIDINFSPPRDADKMIQYVVSIKGYLFGYFFI